VDVQGVEPISVLTGLSKEEEELVEGVTDELGDF
jgi:hypothetical protein